MKLWFSALLIDVWRVPFVKALACLGADGTFPHVDVDEFNHLLSPDARGEAPAGVEPPAVMQDNKTGNVK